MKPTEEEFYDRLNDLDDDGCGWLIGHLICGISGSVVGFLIGYFLGSL